MPRLEVALCPSSRDPLHDTGKNALAVLLGLIVGGGVNMSLVVVGPITVPPPVGVGVTDADAMAAASYSKRATSCFRFLLTRSEPSLAHSLHRSSRQRTGPNLRLSSVCFFSRAGLPLQS